MAVLSCGSIVVGHIPSIYWQFVTYVIRRTGIIVCQVTGPKHYSYNLVQGGLKIPCECKSYKPKVCSLIEKAPAPILKSPISSTQPPPFKKAQVVDPSEEINDTQEVTDQTWLSLPTGCFLTLADKETLVTQ